MGVNRTDVKETSKTINAQNLCVQDIGRKMASVGHSNKINKINETTDLDRYRLTNERQYGCQNDLETRCLVPIAYGLHKKEDEYGKKSIIRRRVQVVVYGCSRRAADLKCKCARDSRECMHTIGRTTNVRVSTVLAVIGLLLMLVTTSAAAPVRSRQGRSAHHEKAAVSPIFFEFERMCKLCYKNR